MNLGPVGVATIALVFFAWGWQSAPTQCQEVQTYKTASAAGDSQDAARRKIMDSDRWRQAERRLNDWLSVQKIYTADEVSAMRTELAARTAKMSPRELEDLMKDMEDRLAVLTSPEAEDARLWLSNFMAVAVNPEEQLGLSRPDVLNMTAGQIRLELMRLQQVRDSRLQAQAAFERSRELQAQASVNAQTARQGARPAAPNRSNWPANTPQARHHNRQRREPMQPPFRPQTVTVTPWGTHVSWHR